MQGTPTAGSPTPGLAETLTLLQLTPMVLHLDMAHLETHMLPQLGIHTGHETHMHHLAEHLITHQLIQHLLHISLKHLLLGKRTKQALRLAEGLNTTAIHMLHCNEIPAISNCGSVMYS